MPVDGGCSLASGDVFAEPASGSTSTQHAVEWRGASCRTQEESSLRAGVAQLGVSVSVRSALAQRRCAGSATQSAFGGRQARMESRCVGVICDEPCHVSSWYGMVCYGDIYMLSTRSNMPTLTGSLDTRLDTRIVLVRSCSVLPAFRQHSAHPS